MPCLDTVSIEIPDGLKLSKSLKSHQILRNVNLILQTIDDLYVLLDGLVPNVQKMIIQLCQSRLLSMYNHWVKRNKSLLFIFIY
jgi:hypothetical protein